MADAPYIDSLQQMGMNADFFSDLGGPAEPSFDPPSPSVDNQTPPSYFSNENSSFDSSSLGLGAPFQYEPGYPATDSYGSVEGDRLSEVSSSSRRQSSQSSENYFPLSGSPAPPGLPLSHQHLANLAAADLSVSSAPSMGGAKRPRSNSQPRPHVKQEPSFHVNLSTSPAPPSSFHFSPPRSSVVEHAQPPLQTTTEWGQTPSSALKTAGFFLPLQLSENFEQQQQPHLVHAPVARSQPSSPNRATPPHNFNSDSYVLPSHAAPTRPSRPRSTTVGSFYTGQMSSGGFNAALLGVGHPSSSTARPLGLGRVPSSDFIPPSLPPPSSGLMPSPMVGGGFGSRNSHDDVDVGMSDVMTGVLAGDQSSGVQSATGGSSGYESRLDLGSPHHRSAYSSFPSDLSAQVSAMSLENRLMDIQSIIEASDAVTQRVAAIKVALLEGRPVPSPEEIKEIGDTIKAVASLEGLLSTPPASSHSLLPTVITPREEHIGTPSDAGSGSCNVSVGLTIDVAKSLTAKRPLSLSSPLPVADDLHLPKHPRRSEGSDEMGGGTGSITPSLLHPSPPALVHSQSFPNASLQVLPSQSDLGVSQMLQPRSASAMGFPTTSSQIAPVPSPIPSQHGSIVPSPLAMSSRAGSPDSHYSFATAPSSLDPSYHPYDSTHRETLYAAVPSAYTQPPPPTPSSAPPLSRRTSSTSDGRPMVRLRGLTMSSESEGPSASSSSSVAGQRPPVAPRRASHSPPDEHDHVDDGVTSEDSGDEGEDHKRNTRRRRSSGADTAGVKVSSANFFGSDLATTLDDLFLRFLGELCSDTTAKDSKGETIHQTLMPKKMQRLDESPDFRPFKFRIQAFTTAFSDFLNGSSLPNSMINAKKIKNYLWSQPYISRFNEDGKKSKSKGNHIWNVEARKDGGGGWIFRSFQRKITGQFSGTAFMGVAWQWAPRVWDPHQSSTSIEAIFSSPAGSLPPWLAWENNVLSGTPPSDASNVRIEVTANYIEDDVAKQLSQSQDLIVTSFGDHSGMAMSRGPAVYPVIVPAPLPASLPMPAPIAAPPPALVQQPFYSAPLDTGFPSSMSSGLVAAQYPSQAMSLPQAFQPPSQAPAPHMPQFMTDAGAERNVRAAQNAVLQAVEESGFGNSYQRSDPQLVSESSAITQTVLAQAQAEQHQYFMTTGRFDNEFATKTIEDASFRAQQAVLAGAELLGASASSSDIIRAGSSLLGSTVPPPHHLSYPTSFDPSQDAGFPH